MGDAVGTPESIATVDTVWTVPNLVTLVRLLLLPVFVWVLFGLPSRQTAAWMLGILGATDWIDGYLARRLGQTSEFGKKFDPTVDRLWFVVAVVSIIVNGSIPIWFAVLVLGRELVVGTAMVVATLAFRMQRFDVTRWGKLATFLLMFAVPGFLMSNSSAPAPGAWEVAAWCFGVPGIVLSYYTAVVYVPLIRDGVRAGRAT